jgi:hypothetical protein
MFDAVKALFFGCGDELPVLDETSGGVTVEGVDSKNVHKGISSLTLIVC